MDQNGSVHEFEYDLLGRQIVDKATTLGTDVDDVVRRVEREYGVHGMLERTANYDATTAGSVVNDVEFTYNGFGQLTVDSQEHDGEVDGNTLDVQYAHVAGASNLYRRALTTYPNGRVLYYYYGGICGYISRPYYVRDYPTANDTCHGVYYYQGLDEIIRHTVNLSGVVTLDRAYDNGSGGYSDRFGRLTDLYWYGWVSQACVAQVKHDYDRVSNRLCREDVLAKSQGTPVYIDELYTYDGMHQLTAQQRGELNVAHDGLVANSKTFAEQWTLDPTGNWSEFKQDTDGDGDWDLDQDRDHTVANEVLEIDDATTHVAHDRAGNMTRIPKPSDWSSHYHLAYDAWNRLVCVYDSDGETPISAYYYDGLGRRVIKDLYDEGSLTSRRHYYYSDTWQVLEERLETSDGSGGFDTAIVDRQYVWGLRYVDDLLSRDRNTDGASTGDYGKTGSGLDECLMVLQDANYNVCAVANTTGVCLERYNYTSYGEPNCLTPAFADRASTDYDWDILYTGRQYDFETGLYQYRNRYYHPQLGRFINRDPMGYWGKDFNLYRYVGNGPLHVMDPCGLKKCKITIYGGHNYEIKGMIDKDYPKGDEEKWPIPEGECIIGVGCGSGADVDDDGKPDSLQDYFEKHYTCNSVYAPRLREIDNPLEGMKPTMACTFMKYAVTQAKRAARRMIEGKPSNPSKEGESTNPSKGECPPECDSVDIVIKCDKAMENLLNGGVWTNPKTGEEVEVHKKYRRGCTELCGTTITIPRE